MRIPKTLILLILIILSISKKSLAQADAAAMLPILLEQAISLSTIVATAAEELEWLKLTEEKLKKINKTISNLEMAQIGISRGRQIIKINNQIYQLLKDEQFSTEDFFQLYSLVQYNYKKTKSTIILFQKYIDPDALEMNDYQRLNSMKEDLKALDKMVNESERLIQSIEQSFDLANAKKIL